jgi:short-subunit dehydrogenase
MNIVITGASKGIGFEAALRLNTDPNNKIVAIARSKSLLENLKQTCKYTENIHILPFDFKKFGLYKSDLIPQTLEFIDQIDVLINNAGLLVNKSFSKQNEEDIDRQLDINFKAPFMLTQLLLPFFNKGAHILNISSMGGVQGSSKFSGLSAYSASKGALAVLTEVMAEELKDQNIKANCLALGATQTEMLAEAFPGYEAPISAAEMGKYVADFAINGHKFYNGKILPVALSTP